MVFRGDLFRRPIATIMLMVGFLLIGSPAYVKLPISSLPNVDVATFLVTAEMTGADPQTSASAVTTPLETQFGQIPGLTQMTSSSANSYSGDNITVRSRAVAGQRGG